MSVTRLGVSLLKVVATIDRPASHHGTERPEAKNSVVLFPARLPKNNAGTKQIASVARTMTQSISARCMLLARRSVEPFYRNTPERHGIVMAGESEISAGA